MFFFIDPSFASIRQASANDADIIAPFRMDDNQQLAAIGASNRDKAIFLLGMRRVWDGQRERIGEDGEASSNWRPCFAALDAAFLSFHSKVSDIQADHDHWCCSVPRSS